MPNIEFYGYVAVGDDCFIVGGNAGVMGVRVCPDNSCVYTNIVNGTIYQSNGVRIGKTDTVCVDYGDRNLSLYYFDKINNTISVTNVLAPEHFNTYHSTPYGKDGILAIYDGYYMILRFS